MVTNTAHPPQAITNTQDRLQYTVPLASMQCNYSPEGLQPKENVED